jgi:hypothetical protein
VKGIFYLLVQILSNDSRHMTLTNLKALGTHQMAESSRHNINARDVAKKLRKCKTRLENEVRELSTSLVQHLPRDYEFKEAGSFWSYLLHDVTDVNVMFQHRAAGRSASLEDAEALRSAAEEVLQAVMKYRVVFAPRSSESAETQFSRKYDNWEDCRRDITVRDSPLLLPSL